MTTYPAIAKAIYEYQAANPDELTIKEGDILTVESPDENGWCKGRAVDGKEGLFPLSYIEILDETAAAAAKISHNFGHKLKAKVIYAYDAQNEDELTIRVGDIICDVDNTRTDGWWVGKLGKRGLFPKDYVQLEGSDDKPLPPAIPAKNMTVAAATSPNAIPNANANANPNANTDILSNVTNFMNSFFQKKALLIQW